MRRQIRKALNEHINPFVSTHGGHIDLVDYIDGNVYLKMSGGCQGCSASTATLKQGVERMLREQFGDRIREIIDTTDHGAGSNPYYN